MFIVGHSGGSFELMLTRVLVWLAILGQPGFACCGGMGSNCASKDSTRRGSCCGSSPTSAREPKSCCCGPATLTCQARQCLFFCGNVEAPKVPSSGTGPAGPDYPYLDFYAVFDTAALFMPSARIVYDAAPIPFKSHALRQARLCVWLK
jgi:hypothetical protein